MELSWKSQKNIAPERHPSHFCCKNTYKMPDLELIRGSPRHPTHPTHPTKWSQEPLVGGPLPTRHGQDDGSYTNSLKSNSVKTYAFRKMVLRKVSHREIDFVAISCSSASEGSKTYVFLQCQQNRQKNMCRQDLGMSRRAEFVAIWRRSATLHYIWEHLEIIFCRYFT